jgi:hypothetical protein
VEADALRVKATVALKHGTENAVTWPPMRCSGAEALYRQTG